MSLPSPEDTEDAFSAVLRDLSRSATQANLARSALIGDALAAAEAGRLDEPQRLEAANAAHQVVGSAGTFGLPGASRMAARLEAFFASTTSASTTSTTGAADDRAALLDRARAELEQLTELLTAGPAHQDEE